MKVAALMMLVLAPSVKEVEAQPLFEPYEGCIEHFGTDSEEATEQTECSLTVKGGLHHNGICTKDAGSGSCEWVQCSTGQFMDWETKACNATKVCDSTEWTAEWATATSDTDCRKVTDCTENQYLLAAATETSNNDCRPITTCVEGKQWAFAEPTTTSDRDCRGLTECASNQWEVVAPGRNNDRQCQSHFNGVNKCETCHKDHPKFEDGCSCILGAFSKWEECSVSCGDGQKFRVRTVIVGALGGGDCDATVQTAPCRIRDCPAAPTDSSKEIIAGDTTVTVTTWIHIGSNDKVNGDGTFYSKCVNPNVAVYCSVDAGDCGTDTRSPACEGEEGGDDFYVTNEGGECSCAEDRSKNVCVKRTDGADGTWGLDLSIACNVCDC